METVIANERFVIREGYYLSHQKDKQLTYDRYVTLDEALKHCYPMCINTTSLWASRI